MSFNVRAIREIPSDPITRFANELGKKLSRFLTKDQIDALEDNEDIYSNSQDFDSVIRFHGDELAGQTTFLFNKAYYPPNEPDGDKLRVWIRGVNLGNTMTDWSGFDRVIQLEGDPMLVSGESFDDGIKTSGTKSIALRFNRPNQAGIEHVIIKDADAIDAAEFLVTGISFFIRFRVASIEQYNGGNRTLYEKTDNETPNDGVILRINTSGRLELLFKRTGIEYAWQTPTSTIAIDTVYDVWVTFTQSDKSIHIYVNNVDQTLTAGSITSANFHETLTNKDWYIMKRGHGSNSGYTYGDLYDFRIYREKIISATEVSRMWTNKWTIADIPFGQVMITNYWATMGESISGLSYTTNSFTSTSFTTT